ncbi:TetR family transcriptional regulator [Solirubrobacter phytolaccae]|uniref:TetR family transcriptional regulator n=1 Tax=Solirubrobacter phytolaccae TaxID=1404360 RepID=A0A9X3SGK1_9ACTN|nr:TetR family transcriptional regulator [Solirubrobacter phytolaccae]MDA0182522.1 TetR family transcriptional regulator [Solirubrobacter phytolaccae]
MSAKTDGRRAAGAETRRRLLAAATELLAERGESGLTLRAVSAAAEANVAAVQYHFGSREALVATVVAEASRPVVEAQLAALDALPTAPTAAQLIEAWAHPLIRVAVGTTAEERRLGRIVGQTLAAPLEHLDVRLRELATAPTERLIAGLERALPDVGRAELTLRVALLSSALAGFASGAFEPWVARSDPERELEARVLDRLVRLTTT